MNRAEEIVELQRKIDKASAEHKGTGVLMARLCSLRMRQLSEENEMTSQQDARDAQNRQEIVGSCRVIKSHASFIGVAAQEIAYMPQSTIPVCMDELNEAEGVMRRALDRIERAKEALLLKAGHQLAAAE